MILLTDVFSLIQSGNAIDVASSVLGQGCVPDISIPIYEIFYLKLSSINHIRHTGMIESIQEYSILREIGLACGGVCASINLLDMDILTLVNTLLVYTPNFGFNIFIKRAQSNMTELAPELIQELAGMAGIPVPDGLISASYASMQAYMEFANGIQNTLFDKLVDEIDNNCASANINIATWDKLYNFYIDLRNSGEMGYMQTLRASNGGSVF